MQIIEANINNLSHAHLINLREANTNPSGPYGYLLSDPESLIDFGSVEWRRNMVTSPYMHGAYEATAVLDMAPVTFQVSILGDPSNAGTHTFIHDRLGDFVYQIQSAEWELEIILGGMTYRWLCLRANYQIKMDRIMWRGTVARVIVSTLRYPIPIEGAF